MGPLRARHDQATRLAHDLQCGPACQPFCKAEKAPNHCSFCRCSRCSFCGNATSTSMPAAAAAPRKTWLERVPSAVLVTSVFLPHLVKASSVGYANTLFARPLPLPTMAYFDGGRLETCPSFARVTWIELARVQPWAGAFVRRALPLSSAVQRAYQRRALTCVARVEVPATPANGTCPQGCARRDKAELPRPAAAVGRDEGGATACKDVLTAFKVAALFDSIRSRPSDFVLWVDVDVLVVRAPDHRFWGWTSQFDVATIGSRPPHNPETGIFAIATFSEGAQRLAGRAAAVYGGPADAADGGTDGAAGANTGDVARALTGGGFNDVQALGHNLALGAAQGDLRVGWFAVGCRPSRPRNDPAAPQWLRDSAPYQAKSWQLCPTASGDANYTRHAVSPFNVLEYFAHQKHGVGPTAFRSSAR